MTMLTRLQCDGCGKEETGSLEGWISANVVAGRSFQGKQLLRGNDFCSVVCLILALHEVEKNLAGSSRSNLPPLGMAP